MLVHCRAIKNKTSSHDRGSPLRGLCSSKGLLTPEESTALELLRVIIISVLLVHIQDFGSDFIQRQGQNRQIYSTKHVV